MSFPQLSRGNVTSAGRCCNFRGECSRLVPMDIIFGEGGNWYLDDVTLVDNRTASAARRAVVYHIRSAVYTPDADGVPTEESLREAVYSAIASQIKAVLLKEEADNAISESAASSILKRPLSSASIGGASWAADSVSTVPSEYQIGSGGLCSASYEILLHAGLLGGAVGHLA